MKKSTIPVKCQSKECRHYGKCPQIKTEVFATNKGKIHIGFIGQGESQTEEETGLPFQGPAGDELRSALKKVKKALGVTFGYMLSNTTRNHPTTPNGKNRPPEEDEIENCLFYLERDIDEIQPQVLVPLGVHATQVLLPKLGGKKHKFSMTEISGTVHKAEFAGKEYTIVPCLHPSYVIQNGRRSDIVDAFVNSLKTAVYQSSLKKKIDDQGMKVTVKAKKEETGGKFSKKGESVLLDNFKEAKDYLTWLAKEYDGQYVGFDTETNNLNKRHDNKILTLQFATDFNKGYIVPWRCKGNPFTPEQFKKLTDIAKDLFFGKTRFKYWIIQNQKFDNGQVMREFKRPITSALIFDTMVGAYLLDETKLEGADKKGAYSLETLCEEMLGFYHYSKGGMKDQRDTFGNIMYNDPEFVDYCGMDAYVLPRLFHVQVAEAQRQGYTEGFRKMMFKFYDPVMKLLAFMEWCGIRIDTDQLLFLMDKDSPIIKRIKEIEEEFRKNPHAKAANDALVADKYKMKPRFPTWIFDLNRPAHTDQLFFKQMKLEPVAYGKEDKHGNAKPSVGKPFQDMYQNVPEVALFTEYKKMQKLVTSYMNQLYKFLGVEFTDHSDGRVRPQFGLTSTTTGRANCSNPNLQQIPRGGNEAQKAVKNMFVPGPNNMFLMLDYATNEVRWLALLSGDVAFCETFRKAFKYRQLLMKAKTPKEIEKYYALFVKFNDIHKQTATGMYRVPFQQVTEDMRQAAKSINFGLMFGRGPKSLGTQIGLNVETREGLKQAKDLIQKWFDACPQADRWLSSRVELAKAQGYVETPFGRRRRLPGINSPDGYESNHAANQAKNSPVQGTASDTSFLAAALMYHEYILPKKKLWRIPMIVHDSCNLEIPRVESEFDEAIEVLQYYFTTRVQEYITQEMGFKFLCPLDIDIECSQPTAKYGQYGYGTAKKWNWTPQSLQDIKKNVNFMSMDEWYDAEGLNPIKAKKRTVLQTY